MLLHSKLFGIHTPVSYTLGSKELMCDTVNSCFTVVENKSKLRFNLNFLSRSRVSHIHEVLRIILCRCMKLKLLHQASLRHFKVRCASYWAYF
jgi:hypothetical protein